MSPYVHIGSAASLPRRRQVSWRIVVRSAGSLLRDWIRRRQRRREFLDYIAIDHRATADTGWAANDARDWAERPFWQP
jgi:hypothetical protein